MYQLILIKTTFVWFSFFTIQFLFIFWKGFILQNWCIKKYFPIKSFKEMKQTRNYCLLLPITLCRMTTWLGKFKKFLNFTFKFIVFENPKKFKFKFIVLENLKFKFIKIF